MYAKVNSLLQHPIFRRVFKNTAMLTGGKGMSAVLGLIYLALAAQILDVYAFGVLILIHTYVVVMKEITSFHSAQCVIRYGADYLENKNWLKLHSLLKFTTSLDVASSLIGALIAFLLLNTLAPVFDLPGEIIPLAKLYCLLIVFNFHSSSTGLLRLLDRFDILAKLLVVVPLVRLLGVSIAWLLDAGLVFFLFVWFLANVLRSLATIFIAIRLFIRSKMLAGWNWSFVHISKDHSGIWRFAITTNIHTSLKLINTQISTLVVGAILGPAAVGLFKIALEMSKVLSKPAQLFTETLYPELAKLVSKGDLKQLWKIIVRAGFAGMGVSALVIFILLLFGKQLITLIFGIEFVPAYAVLMLLMLAGTVSISTFAFDPAMYAVGRPGIPMRAEVISSLVQLAASILLLMHIGLTGAGYAAIIGTTTLATILISAAYHLLKKHPTQTLKQAQQ